MDFRNEVAQWSESKQMIYWTKQIANNIGMTNLLIVVIFIIVPLVRSCRAT